MGLGVWEQGRRGKWTKFSADGCNAMVILYFLTAALTKTSFIFMQVHNPPPNPQSTRNLPSTYNQAEDLTPLHSKVYFPPSSNLTLCKMSL